jgi:hypothetical protein
MNNTRRTFVKTAFATSAAVLLSSRMRAASPTSGEREYYELRCFRLKAGSRLKTDANPALLDEYLEKAMLPALDRFGIKNVGVFSELEINRETATSTPKPGSPVWMLLPHATLDSFVRVSATLNSDSAVLQAGASYLQAPKENPAFERIDSWLLLAFQGMPRLELPTFSRSRTPSRVFELRDYESHSELKALNKIAMFEDGEIAMMKDLGMSPVFYGQALAGPDLPHLRYMTGGPDLATHLANWKKFGTDPRWAKLKVLPQYADNTSKNTSRFLSPKPYSEI